MTYKDYLRTDHWQLLRGAKLQIAPMCELCESRESLEVHHKLYRASWFDTQIRDLQVLCHDCHIMEHAKGWERLSVPAPARSTPKQMSLGRRISALEKAIARNPSARKTGKRQRRLEVLRALANSQPQGG